MAKKETLKEKKVEELKEMLAKKREELRDYRFSSIGARVKDNNQGGKLRKEIARILTELTARKTAA